MNSRCRRHGIDLVGRSNKFRKSREGKTGLQKIAGRRPLILILPRVPAERTRKTGALHYLHASARIPKSFAHPRNQRECESSITRNTEQITTTT